jgi:myo-inositol-1(or 4)-monophosphatase
VNLKPLQQAAVKAAQAAGELMRQNLRAPKKVNAETSHDIKLELDVRCQELIRAKLHRAFPQIALLGEEGSSGAKNAEFRWVVDPIDGTVNYASGIPHACVSIALQARTRWGERSREPLSNSIKGSRGRSPHQRMDYETLAGVVYDPFTDELWTGMRGQPATLNGTVIHASQRRRLDQSIVSIGFAKTRTSLEHAMPYFTWLSRRARKVRMMGSAALALAYVATGRFDAYIERGINLWDIAAGGLILECAGGKFWYEPIHGPHRFRMIASNGLLHSKLPIPK